MFGKYPRVDPLESRKRLLIAESDLNRAQLADDALVLTSSVHSLVDRVSVMGLIGSAASAFSNYQRRRVDVAAAKPSPLQTILKAVGLISSLWLAFLPQRRP